MAAKTNSSGGDGPKSDEAEGQDSIVGDVTSESPKYDHLIDDEDKVEGRDIPETFRAYDTFPAGMQCKVCVTGMPDDENEFGWTDHYENESRERTNPDVTQDVIEELLTEGVCREAPGEDWDNRYLVQKEVDGYEWTLVVADDGEESADRWVMITIYSNYHGSVGTTNKYFDRLRGRRGDDA